MREKKTIISKIAAFRIRSQTKLFYSCRFDVDNAQKYNDYLQRNYDFTQGRKINKIMCAVRRTIISKNAAF